MRQFIVKQLRERSVVKGKQKTWVSERSDDQLYQLYLKLKNEEPALSIAQYAQKAWGVNPESTTHSISQGILKFRRRIADLLELSTLPQADAVPVHQGGHDLKNLDDLMGLELLIREQRERIYRMMREERELGVKHTNLSRDIQSLAALAKVLAKEKEFALRHKDQDPVKQREEELRDQRMDKNFNILIAGLPDDGERVIQACDRLMELAARRSIRMVMGEDEHGNPQYVPLEEEHGDS